MAAREKTWRPPGCVAAREKTWRPPGYVAAREKTWRPPWLRGCTRDAEKRRCLGTGCPDGSRELVSRHKSGGQAVVRIESNLAKSVPFSCNLQCKRRLNEPACFPLWLSVRFFRRTQVTVRETLRKRQRIEEMPRGASRDFSSAPIVVHSCNAIKSLRGGVGGGGGGKEEGETRKK